MAYATSHGQSTTSWPRYVLALLVRLARDMPQRFLLPQDQFHPTPLCTGGKAYPRAVQNGPVRRENAAETTSWSRGRETRFCKSCAFAPNGVFGRRRRSADL